MKISAWITILNHAYSHPLNWYKINEKLPRIINWSIFTSRYIPKITRSYTYRFNVLSMISGNNHELQRNISREFVAFGRVSHPLNQFHNEDEYLSFFCWLDSLEPTFLLSLEMKAIKLRSSRRSAEQRCRRCGNPSMMKLTISLDEVL